MVLEAYEEFCDELGERGFPKPRILVTFVLVLLAAAAFWYAGQAASAPAYKEVVVSVRDAYGAPVGGAVVTLFSGGKQVEARASDAQGIAVFKSPVAGGYVTVEADNFAKENVSIAAGGRADVKLESGSRAVSVQKARALVTDASGVRMRGVAVALVADSGARQEQVTDAFGIAEFVFEGDFPSGAGISAARDGFDAAGVNGVTPGQLGNSMAEPIALVLSPSSSQGAGAPKGSVRVKVVDESGLPADRVVVSFVDPATSQVIGSSRVSGGEALAELPAGAGFLVQVRDGEGRFEDFNSISPKAVVGGGVVDAGDVVLRRVRAPSSIAVTVKDGQGGVVEDAEVFLFDRESNGLAGSRLTDASGRAEFGSLAGGSYYATAYQTGFVPAFADGLSPGDSASLPLEAAGQGNSASVTVEVSERGLPVPGARVSLFADVGGRRLFLGVPFQLTGLGGGVDVVVPRRFGPGRGEYGLVAVASDGPSSGEGSVYQVADGAVVKVAIRSPPGFLNVTVVDRSSKRPVQKAVVTAAPARASGAAGGGRCSTDAEGRCGIVFDSKLEFRLSAEAFGFINYTSLPSSLVPGEGRAVEIGLVPVSQRGGVSAEFEGFFDAAGRSVIELDNSQAYSARFVLTSSQARLAGIYAGLGGEGAGFSSIEGVGGGAPQFSYGVRDCVPVPVAVQDGRMAAKWALVSFNGLEASKEVAFQVRVGKDAPAGNVLSIRYGAFGVSDGGVPQLFPADSAKLAELVGKADSGKTLEPADFCGAKALVAEVALAADALSCNPAGFCSRAFFADDSGARVPNGFSLGIGQKARLAFTVASPAGISYVELSSPYVAAVESSFPMQAGGRGVAAISASAGPGERVEGHVVVQAVKPVVRGAVDLKVYPNGEAGNAAGPEVVTVPVRVSGTNSFAISKFSPGTVALGSPTRFSVSLVDSTGRPVEDAVVTFSSCEGDPFAGLEQVVAGGGSPGRGGNGEYSGNVVALGFGKIGVLVEHPDFLPFQACLADVGGRDFLKVEPLGIDFHGPSIPAQEAVLTVSSSVPSVEFNVSSSARCVVSGSGMRAAALEVVPNDFVLSGSQQVSVKLAEGASAKDVCFIYFNAEAGRQARGTESVQVSIDVSPPPAAPSAKDAYPPVSSSVVLRVGDAGQAQGFYYLGGLGEVTGCRLVQSSSPSISVECSSDVLSVRASYDFTDPAVCFPEGGDKAKLLISRSAGGLAMPEAAVDVRALPSSGRPCRQAATSEPAAEVPSPEGEAPVAELLSYSPLPKEVSLVLNGLAFAEAFYSLPAGSGARECGLVGYGDSEAAVTNFVRVDGAACRNGVVHVVADYSGFPSPPGLYRGLAQSALLRIVGNDSVLLLVPVGVSGGGMSFAPDKPVICGDGKCGAGEDAAACPFDCRRGSSCGNGVKDAGEEGIDCGGVCAGKCASPGGLLPLPAAVFLSLDSGGFASAAYSLSGVGCDVIGCGIRPSFLDAANPGTRITNFVSVDSSACSQGTARFKADYSTFPYLYRGYVGSGIFYAYCADGRAVTRPVRASARAMADLPLKPQTCGDGIQDQGEEGVDCGGPCVSCSSAGRQATVPAAGGTGGSPLALPKPPSAPAPAVGLPPQVVLYLGRDLLAQADYAIPQGASCGGVEDAGPQAASSSNSVGNSPPSISSSTPTFPSISSFLRIECSGGVFHAAADYSNFPKELLYSGFAQAGTVSVAGGSGPGVVRLLVSAARGGLPDSPAALPANASSPAELAGFSSVAPVFDFTLFPQDYANGGAVFETVLKLAGAPSCSISIPSELGRQGRAGYSSGQSASSPQLVYPADYPMECRIPQLLFAPALCPLCQPFMPGLDYFSPPEASPANAAGGSAATPAYAYPPVSGNYPGYDPFAPAGGLGGYAAAAQYPYSQGSAYSSMPVLQPQNLPPDCLMLRVCVNPGACQLGYCSVIAASQAVVPQAPVPEVSCTRDKLVIKIPLGTRSPSLPMLWQYPISINEVSASGGGAPQRNHSAVFRLASYPAAEYPQVNLPLFCYSPPSSKLPSQVIQVTEENTNRFGLPTRIEVALNAFTFKGSYSWRVPVTRPDGSVIPFLCDGGELGRTLKGRPDAVVKCGGDGTFSLSLDYSNSELLGQWFESGFPAGASDAGRMRFQLEAIGGVSFSVPVSVSIDGFSPSLAWVFIDPQTGLSVGGGYESPRRLSSRNLALSGLSATSSKAKAVPSQNGSRILFDVSYSLPLPDLSQERGLLTIKDRPRREVPVFVAQVPHAVALHLDEAGEIQDCGEGAVSRSPSEGECAYPFFQDPKSGLNVGCSAAFAAGSLQAGGLSVRAKEDCSGFSIKAAPPSGANSSPALERGKIIIDVGDGLYGLQAVSIPVVLTRDKPPGQEQQAGGASQSPSQSSPQPADSQSSSQQASHSASVFTAKYPLASSSQDFGADLANTAAASLDVTDAGRNKARAGLAEVAAGGKFSLGVRFPYGDDKRKRSVSIVGAGPGGQRVYYYKQGATPQDCGGCMVFNSLHDRTLTAGAAQAAAANSPQASPGASSPAGSASSASPQDGGSSGLAPSQIACTAPDPYPAAAEPVEPVPGSRLQNIEALIADKVNNYRLNQWQGVVGGQLNALAYDRTLASNARYFAEAMVLQGCFYHDVGDFGRRVWPGGSENIASYRKYSTDANGNPTGILQASISNAFSDDEFAAKMAVNWWNSHAGHKENLMSPKWGRQGTGVAFGNGLFYAVQLFAPPGADGEGLVKFPPDDSAFWTATPTRAAGGQQAQLVQSPLLPAVQVPPAPALPDGDAFFELDFGGKGDFEIQVSTYVGSEKKLLVIPVSVVEQAGSSSGQAAAGQAGGQAQAPAPARQSASFPVLAALVDDAGKPVSGLVGQVTAEVIPGSGRILFPGYGASGNPLVQQDLQEACAQAKAAVELLAGISLAGRDIILTYSGFPHDQSIENSVGGRSAGAATALAIFSAVTGRQPLPNVAVTGALDALGNVIPVVGIPQKAAAAADKGRTTVLVPPGKSGEVTDARVRAVEIPTLAEAVGLALEKTPSAQSPQLPSQQSSGSRAGTGSSSQPGRSSQPPSAGFGQPSAPQAADCAGTCIDAQSQACSAMVEPGLGKCPGFGQPGGGRFVCCPQGGAGSAAANVVSQPPAAFAYVPRDGGWKGDRYWIQIYDSKSAPLAAGTQARAYYAGKAYDKTIANCPSGIGGCLWFSEPGEKLIYVRGYVLRAYPNGEFLSTTALVVPNRQ